MLKNPYGKNWEVSSFYTIYCVAAHTKNTIYCDIPVCNSLKIPRERSRIGSNPITRTISTPQVGGSWQSEILSGCYFHVFGPPQTQSQTLFRRLYGS